MDDMIDKEDLRRTIAANIVRLRTARGWTQEELAERLGIHRVHINRLENGVYIPSAALLYALADAFDTPADTLRQVCEKSLA